jgi:hypothetical protein
MYMGVELWANHMGLKPRCYWEHLGEHIWFGIFWEHDRNTLGKREKKQKNPSPLTPSKI